MVLAHYGAALRWQLPLPLLSHSSIELTWFQYKNVRFENLKIEE
jgi:hypothetical protein